MSSKYADVLPNLPKLPPELCEGGLNYQFRVEMAKQAIMQDVEAGDPIALSRAWRLVRGELSRMEEQEKELRLKLRAYEQLMENAFEAKGINRVDLVPIGGFPSASVHSQPEPHSQIFDQNAFDVWCKQNGHEPEMHLLWQTANAMTKERLLAGMPEPAGVRAYFRQKFVLRNGK